MNPKTKKTINYILLGLQVLSLLVPLLNVTILPAKAVAWIAVVAIVVREALIKFADLLDDGELNNSINISTPPKN